MSDKSKRKPVTLAKSAAAFSAGDAHIESDVNDTLESRADDIEAKPQQKLSKSVKHKAAQEKSLDSESAGSDVIGAYRDLAERSLDQARQAFVKARDEAQGLGDKIEESSHAITQGTSAVQSYMIKSVQSHTDDLFGYFRALADVKTISDVIELQSSQSRKSLDASLRQFKDLSALMNDMVVKASTPIRSALPLGKN